MQEDALVNQKPSDQEPRQEERQGAFWDMREGLRNDFDVKVSERMCCATLKQTDGLREINGDPPHLGFAGLKLIVGCLWVAEPGIRGECLPRTEQHLGDI